jgi:hypothetical protein
MSDTDSRRKASITYINPDAPRIAVPEYPGERHDALVPDTLDLQDMARLAVNGLTEPTDAEADYEIYWKVCLRSDPPFMVHEESDIVQAKFMEALPLLRLISGSTQNLHIEKRWMEVLLQMQGSDGIVYMTKIGRPWGQSNYGNLPPGDHYTVPWFAGRLLGAMTVYSQLTGEDLWSDAARRLADGLCALAIREGDTARFPWHQMGVGGTYVEHDISQAIHNIATYYSWCIQGLANYYRYSRHVPALDLARGLYHWVRDRSNHFGPDGRFLREYPNTDYTHFHGHTMVLLSVLDYGIAGGDRDAVEFAHRGFRYGMSRGECRLGCFSEILDGAGYSATEVCELADMIALALKLSAAGVADYWDMADGWLRNLFAESQFRHGMWDAAVHGRYPKQQPPQHGTNDRVVERNLGTFGGWLAPNDFLPDEAWGWGIMHCCTGNAARAIYYAWEHALTVQDGQLTVNLLMNRASPWVDIDSHIPYAGQVDLKLKKAMDVRVRIPEWVVREDVRCQVGKQPRALEWSGRYACVGSAQSGDTVTLSFPIAERLEHICVEKRGYRAVFRGNTCVAIHPSGSNAPLFQRQHFRNDTTRWRKDTRFISRQTLEW